MINVITVDNGSAMDHLLYPEQNPLNMSYLQNQFANLSNNVCDMTRKFFEGAKATYERIQNSEILQKAKLAINSAKNIFHPNAIVPLHQLDELQLAQPVMQRYIMAFPEIRQLYQEQRCSGYVDTYVDMEPKRIAEDHYDYRRVTDGIVFFNEDGWHADIYGEDLREGDKELNIIEQHQILGTWDIVKLFMDAGEDPTDMLGGKLN